MNEMNEMDKTDKADMPAWETTIPKGKLPKDYRTNMGPAMARCYEEYGPVFRIAGLDGDYIFMIGPEANRVVDRKSVV